MEEKDRDFYDKAYSYFAYHAEQRTTMINYFIAVFGAGLALYGSLIMSMPFACILIAVFLFSVSLLFYYIDQRNKFDVKQSQAVMCAFEEKYGVSSSKVHPAFGVFSNEDNTYMLYDRGFRTKSAEYKRLWKLRHRLESEEFQSALAAFLKKHENVSEKDVRASLSKRTLPHLSTCIKCLYYICMTVSMLGFASAILAFIFIK